LQTDQLLRERSYPIGVTASRTNVHPQVAAIGPTEARKRLSERRNESPRHEIVFVARHEHADAPHASRLLRPHRQRPRCRTSEPRKAAASVISPADRGGSLSRSARRGNRSPAPFSAAAPAGAMSMVLIIAFDAALRQAQGRLAVPVLTVNRQGRDSPPHP